MQQPSPSLVLACWKLARLPSLKIEPLWRITVPYAAPFVPPPVGRAGTDVLRVPGCAALLQLARQRQRARHVIVGSLLDGPIAGVDSTGGSSIASSARDSEECKPGTLPSVLLRPQVLEAVRQYYVQCVLGLPPGTAAAGAVGMAGVSVTLGELAFVEVQVMRRREGGLQRWEACLNGG